MMKVITRIFVLISSLAALALTIGANTNFDP